MDLSIDWPHEAPPTEAARVAPATQTGPGPHPALLPATYVDPSSGVVVLQTLGLNGAITTLPTPAQLDAYHTGAARPPSTQPAVEV